MCDSVVSGNDMVCSVMEEAAVIIPGGMLIDTVD